MTALYQDNSGLVVFNDKGCLTTSGFLVFKNNRCCDMAGNEITHIKRYSRSSKPTISQRTVDEHNDLLEAMQLFALDHCEIKRSVEPFYFRNSKLVTFLELPVADAGTLNCVTADTGVIRRRYLFSRDLKTFAFFRHDSDDDNTPIEVVRIT